MSTLRLGALALAATFAFGGGVALAANTFTGTAGDDVIVGSVVDDTIMGLDGDDTVHANPGADTVSGGAGDDRLFGGMDGDTMSGGAGVDVLYGEGGYDVISARDQVDGDVVWAGDGKDTVRTADNRVDYVNCGLGSDTATIDLGLDQFVDSTGAVVTSQYAAGCETVRGG